MEKDSLYQPSTNHQPVSLRQLLTESIQALQTAGVASPEVDARELLLHALGLNRTALLTRANEEVSAQDVAKVMQLVAQRSARIPLQHLLGEVEWGGIRLKTDARALVPRPETEVLLALAVAEGRRQKAEGGRQKADGRWQKAEGSASTCQILDIGTGTGALALALKAALPHAQVWATDLSEQALALAQENAELNGLAVHFAQGSLFADLPGPFDLIVSNPPYLPEADRLSADPEVQYDPAVALYSGADGLDLARELVAQAADFLTPGGTLLLELDPRNAVQMAQEMHGWHTEVLPDLTGRRRFVWATHFTKN